MKVAQLLKLLRENSRKTDVIPKIDDSPASQVMEAIKQIVAKQDMIIEALSQIHDEQNASSSELDDGIKEISEIQKEIGSESEVQS